MARKCDRCGVKLGFGNARVGKSSFWSGKQLCETCARAINLGEVPSPKQEKAAARDEWRAGLEEKARAKRELKEQKKREEESAVDPAERLKRLEGLYETGMLSPEEYEKKRAEIISDL